LRPELHWKTPNPILAHGGFKAPVHTHFWAAFEKESPAKCSPGAAPVVAGFFPKPPRAAAFQAVASTFFFFPLAFFATHPQRQKGKGGGGRKGERRIEMQRNLSHSLYMPASRKRFRPLSRRRSVQNISGATPLPQFAANGFWGTVENFWDRHAAKRMDRKVFPWGDRPQNPLPGEDGWLVLRAVNRLHARSKPCKT